MLPHMTTHFKAVSVKISDNDPTLTSTGCIRLLAIISPQGTYALQMEQYVESDNQQDPLSILLDLAHDYKNQSKFPFTQEQALHALEEFDLKFPQMTSIAPTSNNCIHYKDTLRTLSY